MTTAIRSSSTGHLATGRIVWTYLPDGFSPAGLITGYEEGTGFLVEHVVVWPNTPLGTLRRMLQSGMQEAWTRELDHLIVMIPRVYSKADALILLARRMGFTEYAGTEEAAWFVRYRPC